MKPLRTKAIVLRRTNYGEADRILQLLTPDDGKISVMAKGVRREKSKLAGGVELFAVSDVSLVSGKGEIWTLTGAKLDTFFAHIMTDYERMQFAYEVIKQVSRSADQVSDPAYYTLLHTALESLDDTTISIEITVSWFWLQLAILEGQGLNLATDVNGMKLVEDKNYKFDPDAMAFFFHENGEFSTEHIKLLRLLSAQRPKLVSLVKDNANLLAQVSWLARTAYAS
jgi:DNA repair protein RecO (recombination protein O)